MWKWEIVANAQQYSRETDGDVSSVDIADVQGCSSIFLK